MKLVLLILYIVNCIFLTSNILWFCFIESNMLIFKNYNKWVEWVDRYKYTILYLHTNQINFVNIQKACPSTINIW